MSQSSTFAAFRTADAPKTADEIGERNGEMFDAVLSSHSGAARPVYAVVGTPWLDTDTGQWFFYDGANDLPIAMFIGTVPAAAGAIGQPGQMFVTAGFLYVCVAVDAWERAVLATF